MKAMKKLFAGWMLFTLIFGMSFAGSAFASSNEVKLIDSDISVVYKSGYVGFSGNIEVANLGPVKNLTVHYTTDNVTWYDTSASYAGATDASHERWHFSIFTNDSTTDHSELKNLQFVNFAIKYEVNNQTYWDNNGLANYYNEVSSTVPLRSVILGAPNVLNANSTLSNGTFSGNIYVKNLNPAKTVKVLYTTDNWATTHEGYATYNGSLNNFDSVENWNYSFNVPGATNVKYAISYTTGGQTYWDNNYGHNYEVH
ncbi:carbohydrate/starch-binding protein with CBM21 domain [Fontibacillus phaseoli]|uniref:Carbohydrate/starch-binding protein with CBM21 domain n=2 Tax=Fontibacillus phaseoli TaxID=1416533 RepID=A0A369BBY4_9BACL|nr:carbohydrate/starch-binding protein with CBM21 domain [Fontibacillus phaseoli]